MDSAIQLLNNLGQDLIYCYGWKEPMKRTYQSENDNTIMVCCCISSILLTKTASKDKIQGFNFKET